MGTNARAAQGFGAEAVRPSSWDIAAERGPDWLFVRLESVGGKGGWQGDLTEAIWDMIREHHANRVVLEFDQRGSVDEPAINAIAELGCRVRREGGLIRACGLSRKDCERLDKVSESGVPHFDTRSEAVGPRGWCARS